VNHVYGINGMYQCRTNSAASFFFDLEGDTLFCAANIPKGMIDLSFDIRTEDGREKFEAFISFVKIYGK